MKISAVVDLFSGSDTSSVNKQISENEEEIKVFYCFSTKKRGRNKEKVGKEIRNFGQNIYPRSKLV